MIFRQIRRLVRKYCLAYVVLILSGCFGIPTEWDIEIWEQKIEGSNLSIYKFDAWGGRDTHVAGFKLKDSSKGFTQNDVLNGDGFSALKRIPNKQIVEVIKTIRPEKQQAISNTPVAKESFSKEGVIISQETYLYGGAVIGICVLQSYKFKNFDETRDSLIFYGNESQFVDGPEHKRISIPKGNIYLMTSKDNKYVSRVVYDDILIFEDLTKSHNIQICRHTKFFDPIDTIKISQFSDYGIYKPVK